MVFPRPQTPSQSIRHPKLHDNRYKNCPDWTILRDFRLPEEQIKCDKNRENRNALLLCLELKNEPHFVLPHSQTTFQSIRHLKILDISYKNCPDCTIFRDFRLNFFFKVDMLFWESKIPQNCPIWTIFVPIIM